MPDDPLSRLLVPGTDPSVAELYATFAERARDSVFGFEDEVVVLDVETTGFDPSRDRLIEVAAARMEGPVVLERFSTFVRPGIPIPSETFRLTGIDDAMVADAPTAEEAVSELAQFVGGRAMIAHNASFDRSFLHAAVGAHLFPGEWLDTLQLSLIVLPRLRGHRLKDLAEAFSAPEPGHRATSDVEALCVVWRVLLCALASLPKGLTHRIADLAPGVEWPLRSLFARDASQYRTATFDLRAQRKKLVATDKAEDFPDAAEVDCAMLLRTDIEAEFAPGGLADSMYPGFECRDEQVRMAAEVNTAFAKGLHAVIEAGTGVGKSVAYLVPAARFAMRNRVSVGVATKTNALMDQLVHSELPALDRALGGGLRTVALKGYEHYLCLRKLERFSGDLGDGSDVGAVGSVAAALAWAAQSTWGDFDCLNVHWPKGVRSQISALQADCTHKRCRFFPALCYLHGVRRRAASAHIVVTNHALLFRDLAAEGVLLPPIRYWIIDEAHSAESEARKQLSFSASALELSILLGALVARGRSGLLEAVKRHLHHDTELFARITRLEQDVATCATLSTSFFDFMHDVVEKAGGESGYDDLRVRLSAHVRETAEWGTASGVGASLVRKLEGVLVEGRELVARLEEEGKEVADQRADLSGLLSRISDQRKALQLVLDGSQDEFVYSAKADRRRTGDSEALKAERLDVGEVLAEDFYPHMRSVVFTSATLATASGFGHFARSVGLDRIEEDAWKALELRSSYDFERQMCVYVPTDLVAPNERDYLKGLETLLYDVHIAMGGSVLTLFTNRRDMDRLHESLEPRLAQAGLVLESQRRGMSAKRLREEFVADRHLSLFATKSFWEGFDAKGETLRCVVIPKLPFGVPTEPLAEERQSREGQKAWRTHALPEAVIELRQAVGRLIRSHTDEGCVIIADSRVLSKSYGREFLGALPVDSVTPMSGADIAARLAERFGQTQGP